jgi:diguanylate cyclase (GGDEF)-like protein
MEGQLEYQAVHDPLTGLFNRRQFSDELERALRFAARYGRAGAVLMIDIDDFKLVNDTHGHASGDQLLKSVAAAIAGRARETDVVARLGGDEFTVVLPEASIEDAREAAEDIRRAVAHGRAPNLSIGIAPFDGNAELVADDVLVAADTALYEAKRDGKNRIAVYTGETRGAMSWVERIRAALDYGRLILYAQPMIDLESGAISHKELLIRMVGDDDEVIPPSAFLPTAERVGLITEIDRWVTKEGLRLAKGGEKVSINLAGPSIGDPEIMEMVRAAVVGGLDPSHLIFEITETAAMTNMEAARDFVSSLNEFGCGVALDDFGTGFGSFTYLKHLATSHLKIDTEFVRDVLVNSTDREVVKSITDVAHSLGKRTVAEGVEDKETLEILRSYGVDCAQGWYLGPPEPIVGVGAREAAPPVNP